MKKLVAAAVAGLILSLSVSAPVQAHAISCATYVGNEDCFQRAYLHNWWHRLLSNPLSVLR